MSELRKAVSDFLTHWDKTQRLETYKIVAAADAMRKALAEPEQSEPMRKHVEQFAAKGGWTKESGEGAFEFVQRISYAQGVEDGRNRPSAPPRREPDERDAVLRDVLDLLGPQAPECSGCAAEWNLAIAAIKDVLKP